MRRTIQIATAALCALVPGIIAEDYFFRFVGGNPTINGQRLRINSSIPELSLGVSEAPYNPADHYSRAATVESTFSELFIVPTNPHPPPVPGHYGLDSTEDVEAAARLVMSYSQSESGEGGFSYDGWEVKEDDEGRKLLRWAGEENSRWIAVKGETNAGSVRWVPWWVRPTEGNMANLTSWDYDIVDLELVEANGRVNSSAPGGVTPDE